MILHASAVGRLRNAEAAGCTPAEAKAVYGTLRVKTLVELRRALAARGTPVSAKTLFNWKKSDWQSKRAASPLQAGLLREARKAAELAGLPDVLSGLGDGDLAAHNMRALLINTALRLGMVQQDIPQLMKTNPRGLAAVVTAARRLIEGGNDLTQETRDMAERRCVNG
jgi:hypothetical protein